MKAFVALFSCVAAASAGIVAPITNYANYGLGWTGYSGYGLGLAHTNYALAGAVAPAPVTYATGAVAPAIAAINPYDYAGQVYPAAVPYLHEEIPAEPYIHEEIPAEEYVHEEIPAEPYIHEEIPAEPYIHQEIPAEPYIHQEPIQVAAVAPVATVAAAPAYAGVYTHAAAPITTVAAAPAYAGVYANAPITTIAAAPAYAGAYSLGLAHHGLLPAKLA